ncbi:MAG: hypothetical protein ABI333_23500 [bacterium]
MTGRATGLGARALGICFVAALLTGCNWLTASHPSQLRQGLVVRCQQNKALLYVNERLVGTVDVKNGTRLGLKPGSYRVAVKRAGFFSRYLDLHVRKDEYRTVRVDLKPELD